MDKSLPYDIDAERAVLGACLLDREAIIAVLPLLSLPDFGLEKHAQIYEAMLDCYEARIPPDLITVAGRLREVERLDQVGGMSYLGELHNEVFTAVHVEHYAKQIADTAAKRRAIQLGGEITARVLAGGSIDTIYNDIGHMVDLQRRSVVAKESWEDWVTPANALYNQKFDPTRYIIQDILPEGTMLITGKPKTKKSWLALNFCWAVATGGKALGHYQAMQGDALYIDKEMGDKRLHSRLHTISPEIPPPTGWKFSNNKWPRVGEGFEDALCSYAARHKYLRLVVVDTMIGVRPRRSRSDDPYESDKEFTQALTDVAHELGITIICVHHSRKADGSDVTDDASGSTGLTGGVDNFAALRLSREDPQAGSLHLVGRDIEYDGEIFMKWEPAFAQWTKTEKRVDVTPERRKIIELLVSRPGVTYKDLAVILNKPAPSVSRLLGEMRGAGLVINAQGGWFVNEKQIAQIA